MRVVCSTLALFLSLGYEYGITNGQYGDCNATATGCSRTDGCHVEFVADAVYGCTGEWENSGITNGDYLCADGYDICDSVEYAEELGLTYDLCMNASDFRKYYYYISSVGYGSTYQECTENGTNGLFGCARMSDYLPWLDYLDDNTTCGPFAAYLDNDLAGLGNTSGELNPPAWAFGWEVWDNGANGFVNMVNYVRHEEAQAYAGGTDWNDVAGYYIGGLMCCASANSSNYSTTSGGGGMNMNTTDYTTTSGMTSATSIGATTTGAASTMVSDYSTSEYSSTNVDSSDVSTSENDSTMDSSNTPSETDIDDADSDSGVNVTPLTIFFYYLATLVAVKLLM